MKNKGKYFLLSLMLASAASAAADSPAGPASATDPAFLSRGRRMMSAGNYRGTIDQLSHIDTENIPLSDADAEEFLFLLGSAYYHTSDPRCLSTLESFVNDYPASVHSRDARIAIADFYFFAHDWRQALDAYRPLDIEAFDATTRDRCAYRKALCMIRCGEYNAARPLIRSLARNKDYQPAATYYDAYIDYAEGRDTEALEKFIRVSRKIGETETRNGDSGLYPGYYIAQILFRKGDWEGCIATSENLIRRGLLPEMELPTARVLGLAYYESCMFDHARGVLESYVDKAGAEAASDALYALGSCEYSAGELSLAASRFSRVADEDSAIGQGASLYLGQIEARVGSSSAAAMNFERACRMNHDRKVAETALYNYVAARSKGGNIPFDSSVEMLEQFIRTYPHSEYAPAIDRHLASLYYSQGDYDAALGAIRRIPSPSASDLVIRQKILYGAGSAAMSAGSPQRAATLLQECAGIRGADPEIECQANIWLGDALYTLKDHAGAERAYAAAETSGLAGRNTPLLNYDLGYALLMQDKFTKAQRAFRKAIAAGLSPKLRRDAEMRMADCKYYTGDYAGALTDFARLRDGEDADYALYRHAQMLGLRGDTDGKIRELEMFERQYSSSRWLPNALGELADTYASAGDNVKAAAAYGRMLEKYPVAPGAAKAALGRANALMASGDTDRAVEAYRELLLARPASDEARLADRELRRYHAANHTLPEYAAFLEGIPGYTLDAADIDDLAYSAAESDWLDNRHDIKGIRDYIARYPAGRHLAEAYSIYAGYLSDKGESREALAAYRQLERHGGVSYASEAYTGIMRNADSPEVQLEYARRLRLTGGADADALEEADFYEAAALIESGDPRQMRAGEAALRRLAENPYSLSGARSAVTLARKLLDNGDPAAARDMMEEFTSSGSGQQYWVARGFIVLADAYSALGKGYLAKEYLKSLRQNYPGKEEDIRRMISERLK